MDLKSFREDKLKIKTQAEFAELIGVEQSNISRWEKSPDSISWEIIQKILEKTGATFEELTGWKKPIPEALKVNNTWKTADFTKYTLAEYISNQLTKMDIDEEQRKTYVDELDKVIKVSLVKPQVAIVGRSDTGKSTLINALLGTDKMPTSWTPTTSIAVYIKHISDKPSFIKEDVWVFANHVGDENLWDNRKLDNEDYCQLWKIGAGGIEILRSFGTRQGENYGKEAGAAVVFIDAPILQTCDIVDLPGFGTETESDDNITFSAAHKAEVIIYLSQANGFMRIEDITYLKRNIRGLPIWEKKGENELPPLSNLFIVASHAHTVDSGNRVRLKEILDVGCTNFIKTLPDEYWAERQKQSEYNYSEKGYKELRARFFAYTVDIKDICKPFEDSLKQILEALPVIINERTKKFVQEYVSSKKSNLIYEIKQYEGIIEEQNKYFKLLEEIERNELSKTQDNDKRKNDIREEISKLCRESIDEFSEYISKTINIDSIVNLMKEKGIKNKKDDVELFGSSLQSMIQERCESILVEKSKILSKKTEDYITAYTESVKRPFGNNSISTNFNAGWIFTSALSAISFIGGLGVFIASSISGAVIFTGLGLSLGGSIYWGIMTSSIFGPIGIALGLLLAGGLVIAKLFGGGWEKNVAKKIIAAFDENEFNEKFRDGIREYWNQTESAFNQAAAKLDEDWDTYVRNLRNTVSECDSQELQNKITNLNYLSDFFDNIPL